MKESVKQERREAKRRSGRGRGGEKKSRVGRRR